MIAINEWHYRWSSTVTHLDTYSNQEMNHGTSQDKPSREWTCILYLNDNYKGGRTYVADGEVYEPEEGSGLLFQGIYILHGVEKVRRHLRHTISYWFTTDIERCMLSFLLMTILDEDSWRLSLLKRLTIGLTFCCIHL